MGKCTKVAYGSQMFADADLIRILKTSNRKKKPIRSYYCFECKSWHLTSQEGKSRVFVSPEANIALDNITIRNQELERDNASFKNTISQLSNSNNEFRFNNEVLQSSNERLQKELFAVKQEIASLKNQNNQLRKKHFKSGIETEQQNHIAKLVEQIKRLRKDNNYLINKLQTKK